jgi:hemerythrin-like domain-containing protein
MNTTVPPSESSRRNATSVPDLSSYRQLHGAMRTSLERLVVVISSLAPGDQRRERALLRWFTGFSGELHAHHCLEDTLFFPALADRVPAYADCAEMLDMDHQRIDDAIEGLRLGIERVETEATADAARWRVTRENLTAHAVELRDLMVKHLDFEDADVLPMFERHFSAAEYAVLDKQALKSVKIRQALFTVPWWMATVEPDVAARTLRDAPLALKFVYRLTRRRYTRLERKAFASNSPLHSS